MEISWLPFPYDDSFRGLPSMWPQPFSCGNWSNEFNAIAGAGPSMWPQPFSCGNIKIRGARIATLLTLQCGHSLSAVEMPKTLGRQVLNIPPSMWPQPFSCGNTKTKLDSASCLVFLQCGHSLSAVEISNLPVEDEVTIPALQCGHSLSAVEMAAHRRLLQISMNLPFSRGP